MDNEPAKNGQFDGDIPQSMEDIVRKRFKMGTEKTRAAMEKLIPSYEEIVAGQGKPAKSLPEDTAGSADNVENEKQIDPLETVKELKLAISKAEAELAPEEIESLLSAEDEDSGEETGETEDKELFESGNEMSLDTDSGMDELANLKKAIAEAQEQLETDEIDDIEENEETHTLLEPEDDASISRIPRFELTEKILSEQRKTIANRRLKPSGATQADDRAGVHGILGKIVRADRAERARKAESDATRQPLAASGNIILTPATYNILKDESRLTQTQRKIISDIVTADIARHYAHVNSVASYKQA